MVIKDAFSLLKDVPNILNLPGTVIRSNAIPDGQKTLAATLKLIERRIDHFTKERIYHIISSSDLKKIDVVSLENYNLPVSYNAKTGSVIINLRAFGVDDISRIDPRNVYACVVYGVTFSDLVKGRAKVKSSQAANFINYFLALMIRLFGKEYGLIGVYSTEIPKLKFLLSCYVLSSFFGEENKGLYRKASILSTYNYRDIEENLSSYDFSKISYLISSLSDLKVMPGINQHLFTARILRHLTINFIPALEDVSRCISILATSTLTGSSIVPTFIHSYNTEAFNNIVEIARIDFRKR